jgi:RNA polymerase sigma factor (sigma-70 family)
LRALLFRDLPHGLSLWLSVEHSDFEFLMEYTAQVSLARILNKLDAYEGRSQFTSWVDKIAVRIALNEWRRLQWRDIPLGVAEKKGSNDRPLSLFGLPNRSPLSLSTLDDLRQRIQPILVEELSAEERLVLFALYFQGMPIKEVARRLDTSRSTVYEVLHSVRLRLIQRLAHEGLAPKELLDTMEKGDLSNFPSTDDKSLKSVFDWFRKRSKRRLQPDAAMPRLLRDLAMTGESEISCEDIYAVLDQFVEATIHGESGLPFMPLVRQHLALCTDCGEECEALLRTLSPASRGAMAIPHNHSPVTPRPHQFENCRNRAPQLY